MARLRLTLALGEYDRTLALKDGRVVPEGIDLNYIALETEEIFYRMLVHREFDVSEMSLAKYLTRRRQGRDDLIAIPVFPSRVFRHSSIYVHRSSGIQRPKDLEGQRLGVPEWAQTAGVWARGMLQDDFGVNLERISWCQAGLEQPGRVEKVGVQPPTSLRLEVIADRALSPMLEAGELDAVICARAPSCFDRGDPNVVRLFPDYPAAEREYFARTKLFPIMHTVVIKQEVYQAHPWVAGSLVKAFEQAKRLAYRAMATTGVLVHSVVWLIPALEEQRALFGSDPFPYGLEANRPTLETFIRYLKEQYLIEEACDPAQVFAPDSVLEYRI